MNPEEIQALLAEVAAARAEGMSDREINAAFRQYKVPFADVRTLERNATNMGITPPAESKGGVREAVAGVVRPALQGATFGLGSDFLGLLDKAGLAPEGAGETFREGLADAREDHPIRSFGLQMAGTVAGAPGAAAKSLLFPAVKGAGNVAARGGAAAARALGAGPLTQLGAREGARGMATTAAGAAAGAAEGGLMAFGESAGSEDREGAAKSGGLFGALVGGPLAGAGSAVRSLRTVRGEVKDAGQQLASTARRVGLDLPTRRDVAGRVEGADAARKAGFQMAEDAGEVIPASIFDNPTTMQALRRSRSQEGRALIKAMEEAAEAGEPLPAVSVRLADDIRKDLKHTADAFAKRKPDASGKVPSATAAREAQEALDEVEGLLRDVPGFEEGLKATSRARSQDRAYQVGRRLASQPVDVVEDVVAGIPTRRGNQTFRLTANTAEEKQALRAGLAEPILQALGGGQSAAATFLKELPSSPEMMGKMRIILGGEMELQSFLQEADRLVAVGQADRAAQLLIKAAGFIGFGTSLFGGVISEGLLGPR